MAQRSSHQKGHKSTIKRARTGGDPNQDSSDDEHEVSRTERRMKEVVRSQGRLTKKGGVLMSSGASEFQVVSSDALAKLLPSGTSANELHE